MAKPIYAGTYTNRGRGRWKRVFIIIVLIQIVIVGVYLWKRQASESKEDSAVPTPAATAPASEGLDMPATPLALSPSAAVSTTESRAAVADAKAAIAGGQLVDAKILLDKLVSATSDPEAIELLGEVNMKLLKSPLMMPGKEYYVIQPGDYLQKIAKQFNTTVELIQEMNGLETDVIRSGARLLVFNSNFSMRVSKTQNHLDLLMDGRLFKR